MPDLVLWATAASLLGVSILVPAATGGGWMWLLPAVMVPVLVGWVVLQRMMAGCRTRFFASFARPRQVITTERAVLGVSLR